MLFCDKCKRDKQSPEPNKGVFPIGSVSPTYYILGDVVAPLEETDSIFTEQLPQYKFLMNTLVSAGLDLNSLRFFKLTRCGNILDEELEECRECCSNYCKVDIAKTNPDLIITLGAEPTKALIGSKFKSISSSRGRLYDIELYGKQFKVLPTYSPNYVVNAPDSGGLFLNDILKAKAYMDGELVDIKSKNLEYATTYEEFKAYHDKYLVNSQHPAYDLETNAHDPRSAQARMVGFSLAPDSSTGVYVVRNSLEYSMPEEDWDKVVELTKNYLSTRIPLVHNIMYEKPFTYNEWGYLIDEFDDTLVKARMLRGGDMGSASLKDQCILNLGYPDWDTDLSIYKKTFTTMIKKLKPSSTGKPKWEYDFIRNRGLCALLDEYNSMIASETSMSKNSKDLHENLEEMRDIILKYYISDTDYSCIMETIGDELCNLVDIQYDGPFSYGFIPMKVITKYGAMDAVGTQDLDVYLNSQIDKWSKELDIDMYRGYKYIKRQFVAGVDMELNGLYWNDEIASDCDKWYLEQSQNSLLNLINSPFLDNHLLSNSAYIINEELYKNHLDYVMEVLGPFKPMKSCIKLEDGTKLSYKVILDAVNKKLGYNLQDKYKEESLELIRRVANKDKDIDRLKGFYNPGSTTQYARDLVNSILITSDIRIAHFMNRLHIMLDDPELDINTYPPSDRQLFQVLISCKEYNSKVDKYNEELDSDDRDDEILENLNHELGGDDSEEESSEPRRRVKLSDRDTFDRFMQVLQNTQVQSSKMQSIIMESLSYNLTSVSEDNIIELHRYYLLLGIDLDNPDTWTDEFKFLFNFRMYKKCMKMRSTYIQGKRVGRGKVWVTSRKGLESGELLTKRTRLYTPDISEDEAYLMQASYNVCFSGDTKVKCLDGNSYSFKELVDSGKSELWVYSKTPEGKVVPGKAKNIRMTRQNSKLVEVTLDTGFVIKCTPDHPFMLRTGIYREAQYLTSGDSLMPLNIEKYNHYVVSVKFLDYTEDVYDLEVEKYHNFAIDIGDNQGLFVHNCGAETLRWRTGIHCLEGNTKVKLADGRDLPIKDLYKEYSEGKVNYVYTVDDKGDFLIENITEVQLSGCTNKVAKLHLDNGECIVSTQNHRYLTRFGEYKEVRDLQEGESLMPGYFSTDESGYLEITNNSDMAKSKCHYLADEYNERYNLLRDISKDKLGRYGSWVRHHCDFNKLNNNPDNVQRYGFVSHLEIHSKSKEGHLKQWETQRLRMKEDENYRAKRQETFKRVGKAQMEANNKNESWKKILKSNGHNRALESNSNPDIKYNQLRGRILLHLNTLIQIYPELSESNYNELRLQYVRGSKPKIQSYKLETVLKYFDSFEEALELSKSYNHKVAKVELIELSEPIPVYDLSVKESTPCFLLSSGIVSHNTIPSGSDIKNIYTSRYKGGCIFAPDYCLEGDTRIRLADGTSPKIKDLVGKDHFYVYSYDSVNKKIVIGKGHDCRLVRLADDIVRVTLDTGDVIECTSNHKFYNYRTETMEEIKDMKVGDSLLPLRFSEFKSKGFIAKGRECVIQPWTNEQVPTHYLADDYNIRNGIYESTDLAYMDRHHIDSNKLNNSPENIIRITRSEHARIHRLKDWTNDSYRLNRVESTKKQWESEEFREMMKSVSKTYGAKALLDSNSDPRCIDIRKEGIDKSYKDTLSKTLRLMYENQIIPSEYTWDEKVSQVYSKAPKGSKLRSIHGRYDSFPEFIASHESEYPKEYIDSIAFKAYFESRMPSKKFYSRLVKSFNLMRELRMDISEYSWDSNIKKLKLSNRLGTYEGLKCSKILEVFKEFDNMYKYCIQNHRIVKIEYLDSKQVPVYCFTVDEFHNFFLDCGVLSSNSQMEIRCIAGASKCTPMLEAFKNGADIHMQNAVKIFRKPAEEILPAERRYSKMACTLGNTKIKLADGTIKSVEELYNSGKRDFYAYSFDTESKKVVPGHVVEVSMTKKVKETYKITFDNDKSIEVTSNHKFLLLSGNYIDAKDLSEGDKIETLFYRVPTKGAYAYSDKHPNYYEQIRDVRHKTLHGDRSGNVVHPRYGKWLLTHKEFYRSHYGELTLEKPNIDHQDHNSLNNDPINLRELSQSDNLISSWSKSDKDRFGLLAQAQNIVAMLLREGLELTESNFDQMMEHMYESRGHLYWRTVSKYYTFRDIVYSLASRSGYKNIDESRFEDPVKGKFKLSTIACRTVKSIEVIIHEEEVPVYDLSVERYHNYAIDLGDNSGVFTHNSFMILYGGDYKNFAEEYLDGDLKLGKYIYDSFYEAYPEIKTWIDERHEQMRTTGKVTTPMDYYINVSPEKYGGSESKALRAAQNYPISNIVA